MFFYKRKKHPIAFFFWGLYNGSMTLKELKKRHSKEEAALFLSALRAAGWSQAGAAAQLRCSATTVQKAIARHPSLQGAWAKHGRGRGRPCGN